MSYTEIKPVSFKQTVAADTWVINHGCGYYPVIDVMVSINGTLQKILPMDISNTDLNTITIKFSRAFTGEARLC